MEIVELHEDNTILYWPSVAHRSDKFEKLGIEVEKKESWSLLIGNGYK